MDDGFFCVVCESWQSANGGPSRCGDNRNERRRFELRASARDGAAIICETVEACARHDRVLTREAIARELGDLVRASEAAAGEGSNDGGA